MPSEFLQFAVTIPHGTAEATPHRAQLPMTPRIVREFRVRVPPGGKGYVGWAIGNAGQPVIPLNAGAWIVTNNATLPFVVDGFTTSGTWWLIGYNTGDHDHTIYITAGVDRPGRPQRPITPIPPSTISTGGAGGATGATGPTTGGAGGTLPTIPTTPTGTQPGITLPPITGPPGTGTAPGLTRPTPLPAPPPPPTF